jgi:hypothetical protein
MGDGLGAGRAEGALLLQVEHPLQPKALNAVLVVFELEEVNVEKQEELHPERVW